MILSQFLQRTVTGVSEIRSNFFEPQFVQIGHALSGFTNNIFKYYI
ncbi:uncharacterized protein METZ01_LOCUS75151 [marine metagenome]|uniref:Uncharacterized protein n=1 Tax=marine metagenome TaxID=408172 RepID=A0A381U4R5_9ZZZZ